MKLVCLMLLLAMMECKPMEKRSLNDTPKEDFDYLEYLKKYQYIAPEKEVGELSSMAEQNTVKQAIKDFQELANIPITGKLDEQTEAMMKLPRCGNFDKHNNGSMTRIKRYILQGSSWSKRTLTYKVLDYTKDLNTEEVDTTFAKAFQMWSSVSGLSFRQETSQYRAADIEIRFTRGEHGDGNAFDGPGSVLAHAFYPQYGGNTHFDEDEYWTVGSFYGSNLLQVAVHEFGHSLGLEHSRTGGAVMAPFYRGYEQYFSLHTDDIQGVQRLYGKVENEVPNAPDAPDEPEPEFPVVETPPKPTYCTDAAMDAIGVAYDAQGTVFVFQGDYYLALDADGVMDGYPKPISTSWPGLSSGRVDAMLVLPALYEYRLKYWSFQRVLVHHEKWYLFKGSQVFLYDNQKNLQPGYPKLIAAEFPGVPSDIDAAFVWSRNGRTYFIKDRSYYRFDNGPIVNGVQEVGAVPRGYPRSTAYFRGIPGPIDATLQYRNKRTYFFVGSDYYKINDNRMEAVSGYPRSIATWWYGCTENLMAETNKTHEPELLDMEELQELQDLENSATDIINIPMHCVYITGLLISLILL